MHLLWLWLPVALDAALIFYLSSIPSLPSPPGPFSDKHFHFASYALLAALLVRALASARIRDVTGRVAIGAFGLATLYGVTDEIHQMFVPPRTPDWRDVCADALGAMTGAVVVALAAKLLSRVRWHSRSWRT